MNTQKFVSNENEFGKESESFPSFVSSAIHVIMLIVFGAKKMCRSKDGRKKLPLFIFNQAKRERAAKMGVELTSLCASLSLPSRRSSSYSSKQHFTIEKHILS